MSGPPSNRQTLWALTASGGLPARRVLTGRDGQVAVADLDLAASFDATALEGQSVLIQTAQQLPAVLALLELDGVARRLVLAPPDATPGHLEAVIRQAEITTVIADDATPRSGLHVIASSPSLMPRRRRRIARHDTEWVLFTSGTTAAPKLVSHTLARLTGPISPAPTGAVWSTFYDIRRYGGLQIMLRALLGGGSMVLSDGAEMVTAFLARAGAAGVTHISGTPSHWRRALISGQAARIAPAYVRLSGEIADQTVLDQLRATYRDARIAHAFASTEAGVAFDVTDGLAGFPASWVGASGAAELRVVDDTLRIRSARTATRYLGDGLPLADDDGFVDTGDSVLLRGSRYYFLGRLNGVINVGGQKVHPEEIEAALHAHPAVRAARAYARSSPITGALVAADVVVDCPASEGLRTAILDFCRARLAPYKVPGSLRIVPALEVLPSGKLARRVA